MCNETKPLSEYWNAKGRRDGLQVYCKTCLYDYNLSRQQANPERVWAHGIKHRYGLSLDKYNEILELQSGKCSACHGPAAGKWNKLYIDHDHVTK